MRYLGVLALVVCCHLAALAQDRGSLIKAATDAGMAEYDLSNFHAVLIGINDYREWPDLRCARNDVEALGKCLVEDYGYYPENVTLLLDDKASRRGILQAMDASAKLGEDASLLIYFAGHGWMDENKNGYWIPADAPLNSKFDYVSNTQIVGEYFKKMRMRHLLVISDSCFSGAMVRAGVHTRPTTWDMPKGFRKPSRWFMTSGDLAPVPDDVGNGHSPFANRLLQYLKYSDKPAFGVFDLYTYVRDNLSSESMALPMNTEAHMPGGEFCFARITSADTAVKERIVATSGISLTTQVEARESVPLPLVYHTALSAAEAGNFEKAVPLYRQALKEVDATRRLEVVAKLVDAITGLGIDNDTPEDYEALCLEIIKDGDADMAAKAISVCVDYYLATKQYDAARNLLNTNIQQIPPNWRDSILLKWVLASYRLGDYNDSYMRCIWLMAEFPNSEFASKAVQIEPRIRSKLPDKPDFFVLEESLSLRAKYDVARKLPVELQPLWAPHVIAVANMTIDTDESVINQANAHRYLRYMYRDGLGVATNEAKANDHLMKAITKLERYHAASPDNAQAATLYNLGLLYEMTGDINQAHASFKLLISRFPEAGEAAEATARIAQIFLNKGLSLKEEGDMQAARIKFLTAADSFREVFEKWPEHRIAAKCLMLTAQCHMRAEDFAKAIDTFGEFSLIEDDDELNAEAGYWIGHCEMEIGHIREAYKAFTRLTWDYPESKWAKYARGRLTDPKFEDMGD